MLKLVARSIGRAKYLQFWIALGMFVHLSSPAYGCRQDIRDGLVNFMATCLSTLPQDCYTGKNGITAPHTFRVFPHNTDPNILVYSCGYQCPGLDWTSIRYIYEYPLSCSKSLRAQPQSIEISRPTCHRGSVINVNNRTLGETIPVTDTGFELVYFSNFAPGRKYSSRLKFELTESTVPTTVTGYNVTLQRKNGTVLAAQSFGNSPDQTFTYTWDGTDDNGLPTWGPFLLQTHVEETATDTNISHTDEIIVGDLNARQLGLGGWVPSNWMFYSHVAKRIYSPYGTYRTVSASQDGILWNVPEEDGSVLYSFDSIGRLVSVRAGLTGQVIRSFSYDGNGLLASVAESFGRTTYFHRDSTGKWTSVQAPNGKISTVTIDANGLLSSITNPKSEIYSMIYQGVSGLLSTFSKPNGTTQTFTYDVDGNLITDAHSGGAQTSLADAGDHMTISTALGRVTTVKTSPFSNQSFTEDYTFPDGHVRRRDFSSGYETVTEKTGSWSTGYDRHPRFGEAARVPASLNLSGIGTPIFTLTSTASLNSGDDPFDFINEEHKVANGSSEITTIYTKNNQTFSTTSKEGRTREHVIDAYERVSSDRRGSLTPLLYTYSGDKLSSVSQGPRTWNFSYDPTTHYLSTVTDPLSRSTGLTFDLAGRLSSRILPDNRVISYQYDSTGNLIGLMPPSRPLHQISYGPHELPSAYIPPALGGVTMNTVYSYNLDRQLVQMKRPDNRTVDITYGVTSGRPESVVTPSGTTGFVYLNSDLSQIQGPGEYTAFLNWSNGLPTQMSIQDGSSSYLATYSIFDGPFYMSVGTEKVEDVTGQAWNVNFTYDQDGALTGTGVLSLGYSLPDGLLSTVTAGPLSESYVYNSFGEVTTYDVKYSGQTIYRYELVRDLMGRVTGKTENINGFTKVHGYVYDTRGRLIEVHKDGVVVSTYAYDENSNRTTASIRGTTFSGSFDDQDRLTAYNNFDLAYNANGDLISKTNSLTGEVMSLTTDVFGSTTSVVQSCKRVDYELDPLGRRFGILWDGVIQKRYFHDLSGRLIAELSAGGNMKKRFVYATKAHVPDYFQTDTGRTYRIITDHLGSVRLVLRLDTGAIYQLMEHDEFGRIVQDTNPGFQPFGFAGGLYDPDTRLVKFGARDYDPETGRWTSKDPILFNGGDANLYGYVMSDPVNFIDPTGLMFEGVIERWTTPKEQAAVGTALVGVGATMLHGGLASVRYSPNPAMKFYGLGSMLIGGLLVGEGVSNAGKAVDRMLNPMMEYGQNGMCSSVSEAGR